jgi:sulfofructose kinase
MATTSASRSRADPPLVLCAGIAVVDFIFRVESFPTPHTKTPVTDMVVTGGGCAANAAIAIARLGGRARFAGPLGGDDLSERIIDGLLAEGVDIAPAVRVRGATSSLSGIFVDQAGERLLATRRAQGLAGARPRDAEAALADVDVVLADNHFPDFVAPICAAAFRRGLRLVLDFDRPSGLSDPLLPFASHPVFSAEALRGIGGADLPAALAALPGGGFAAVTDGRNGAFWRDGRAVRHQEAFAIEAVDTLAAGDVFHAAFALALAEGNNEAQAMRFAAAAASLKCARFGGIAGSPTRAAVEELLGGGV